MAIKLDKLNQLLKQTEKYIENKNIDKATRSYINLKVEYEDIAKSLKGIEANILQKKLDKVYDKLDQLKQTTKKEKTEQFFLKKEIPLKKTTGIEKAIKKGKIEELKEKLIRNKYKEELIKKRRHKLKFYLEKAGLELEPLAISKKLFNLCIILNLIISSYLIYYFSITPGHSSVYVIFVMLVLWLFVFPFLLLIIWAFFYLFLDLKIFKRRIDLEEVLPDFLQLTSANIRAGMTIEKALWYAVRPRFGVLAKEIETVAKDTMGGKDLEEALNTFSEKYDSDILKKSVSLLVEGIKAGGEIGSLLNKISLNIQENKVLRKEMAANVTTYVIFISFATVAAAPFLFALSAQLIDIIHSLSITAIPTTTYGFAISFKGAGITKADFKIFAITCLLITSFFSSVIVATIKKGDVKSGIRYIPIFMISTIIWFFLANAILTGLLGKFF